MNRKTIGSAAFVMAVMALAAVLVLTSRADRQTGSILIGVPAGAGENSLEADFTLSKPLEDEEERSTVTFALLNGQYSEEDPESLGPADAVLWMDAEGRPEDPFQYRARVWLTEEEVLVKTDGGEVRRVSGADGQALAGLVRESTAPYAQPRTD